MRGSRTCAWIPWAGRFGCRISLLNAHSSNMRASDLMWLQQLPACQPVCLLAASPHISLAIFLHILWIVCVLWLHLSSRQ